LRSPSKTVGSVVRGFKIGVSEWFRKNTDMSAIWQRNYYEHIIRNETELNQIRQYISSNPASWMEDEENPKIKCL
jgi:putative transposase